MAGEIKISALPLAGAAADADITAGVQSGTTIKQTNSALATYVSGKINLNTAYANTSPKQLNITSGLNIVGTSLVVCNFAISGAASALLEIDSVTQGFLMPRMTATQMNAIASPATGLEVFNTTATAPYFYNGSAWIPSDGASLTINGTTNQVNVGVVDSTYTLSTPQNINTTANFQAGTLGVNLASTLNSSAVFEADSTTQGLLPPRGTQVQRNAISSPATGLHFYNTTANTNDYFDSTQWQQPLTLGHVLQGANMSITNNGDGTMTFASSGGGAGGTQVQGSFTSSSTTNTSVTTTDSPINLASPTYFNVINAVGTSVSNSTVSGITTPIIQNTSSSGRWGIARFDLTMSFSTSATTTFAFTVYTNTGFTTYFKNVTLTYTAGTNAEISFASPLVFLNTNDYMYLAVSCATGSTVFSARTYQGSWVDTTVAGIPNTDALAQGSSNLYLSSNGGTTYQNISGVLTPGNLVLGNTTGGQLIDSGIASSNVVLNNAGTYNISISGNAATVTTNANLTGDVTSSGNATTLANSGIAKVVAITQVSGTSQAMSDTAPINRYFLINSALCTLTLPTSPTVGHVIEIVGAGNASWRIAQNASQSIATSIGGIASSTTPGTSGHADGSNNTDCITLMYVGSSEFVIQSMQTSGAGITLN